MPTIISHPIVASLKTWVPRISVHAAFAGGLLAVLPDADVVSFAMGIPYESTFGHRGFTHSIVFALATSSLATLAFRRDRRALFAYFFFCALSHPLLDALTNGGLGIAFFSPFSNRRYFFPWTPITVSPIGAGFFSARGVETFISELKWVWLPCALLALMGKTFSSRAT
ncbi:MAG: metal-dependent hydrolase [Acidobacteria bacterium]|nr:metal-dependent hydrolase [Acidobacteriota bacterium]MBV9477631.1 metal-dependent hydrolase [Acidobacteriota bacterium]